MKMTLVAQSLQRCEPCNRQSRRMLKADTFWFLGQVGLGSTRIFGKGSFAGTKHDIAILQESLLSPTPITWPATSTPGLAPFKANPAD